MKTGWLKTLAIVAGVAIVGGLVYEAISANSSSARATKLLATVSADNKRLSGELAIAQGRVGELEGIVVELRKGSDKIKAELERSQRLADDLRRENSRLGEALERSLSGTGALTESHRLLGESLDRAIRIVDGLTKGL